MSFKQLINKTIKHYSRYNSIYFRNKCYDNAMKKFIESRIDSHLIQKDYPEFADLYNRKSVIYRNEISPFYQDYVKRVSNPIMALSLELAVFLLVLCELIKPKNIIDFGSGFSSFVFRYYAAHHANDQSLVVWSIDDSMEWLDKTSEFLTAQGLKTDNLSMLDSIIQKQNISFDLILYDYGAFDTRMANLETALSLLSDKGSIIIDDMHGADYAFFVLNSLKKFDFKKYSIRCYTNDKYGRYSFIAKHK